MEREILEKGITSSLKKWKGIVDVRPLRDEDRERILAIENDAEGRSLMGLGKVVNTGVQMVLSRKLVYVAMTNLDFDWGCHTTLLLKKGDEVVGEEIRDEKAIAELSERKDVWFMHRNFVVYKDKVCFPQDIMNKVCHFEIPPLKAEWDHILEDEFPFSIIFANPATPCDLFLKETYFEGRDERGLGTILVGLTP